MKTLDQLTAEDFQGLVGEAFAFGEKSATLDAVETMDAPEPDMRAPFNLVFVSEDDIGVVSDAAMVSHTAIGELELHVTRIPSRNRPAYQIAFN